MKSPIGVLYIAIIALPSISLTSTDDGDKDGTITIPAGKCVDLATSCAEHCKSLREELTGGECENGTCYCRLDIGDILRSALEGMSKKNSTEVGTTPKSASPGVECKNLIRLRTRPGVENHKGCAVHCRLNDTTNKDGRCVDGICRCSREILQETTTMKTEAGDGKCRSRSECSIRCRKSKEKYDEGECVAGRCRCSMVDTVVRHQLHEIPDNLKRKVTRCEKRSVSANEELCRAHCQSFSKDHREGRCVEGVCHCGYAVFEYNEYPDDDNNERDWREKTTETPKRQRSRTVKPTRY